MKSGGVGGSGSSREEEEEEEQEQESVRKKENRSGVGIQHNTAIIITRCDGWLLMKWESAGELPIRPQSSFHAFFSFFSYSFLILMEKTFYRWYLKGSNNTSLRKKLVRCQPAKCQLN